MSLHLQCDGCEAELMEPGALAFSPPRDGSFLVAKYHLCAACWPIISRTIAMIPRATPTPKGDTDHER